MTDLTTRALALTRHALADVDPLQLDLALRLVHEAGVYGVDALPAQLHEGSSGRALAAMVCEDIEGTQIAQPLLVPSKVEVELPPADGEEDTGPRIESRIVRPRILESTDGRGLPSILLASAHPEQRFDVLETDGRRRWFLRRLLALFGLRNVVVHDQEPQDMSFDLLLLKHDAPSTARAIGARWLDDAGQVLLWQRTDTSAKLRTHSADSRGERLRLIERHVLTTEATRGRVLLHLRRECAELDAVGARA